MGTPFLFDSCERRVAATTTSARRRGIPMPTLVAGLASLCLATLAHATANGKWTYGSTTECSGKGKSQIWTCTNFCTCTVGPGAGGGYTAALQAGVQFSPASAGTPTVTVTDLFGNPIVIGGGILTLEPSDLVTSKVTGEYGTLTPDHAWMGFQSNIDVFTPVGTNGLIYVVKYEWSTPVQISPLGASWFSDTNEELGHGPVTDAFTQIPAMPGTPVLDGVAGEDYFGPLAIQDVQTSFGDSNQGDIAYANGSELDGGYGFIANDVVWLTLAGNLESNFNKLEIFFDYMPGGQNRLRGDNPNVDFNGLNRMGDDGSGNGLAFDADFAADFYVTMTCGGAPFSTYANVAEILTTGGGSGRYIGSGGAGPGAPLYGNNGLLIAIDNSNVAGVGGGSGAASGEGVLSGVELALALPILPGYNGQDIKVCAFINGGGHDYVSNQVLGGLGAGTGNLGEPRGVSFANQAGQQYFIVGGTGVACPADLNGDGAIDAADLALLLGGWGTSAGDLNGDGATDAADLALLLGAWGACA